MLHQQLYHGDYVVLLVRGEIGPPRTELVGVFDVACHPSMYSVYGMLSSLFPG